MRDGSTRMKFAQCSALPVAMIVVLIWASGAIGDETQTGDFMKRFAGDPFTGRIEAVIDLPESAGADIIRDRGRGSAQFVDIGEGKVRLVLSGHIKKEGDADFVVDGTYDETGWRGHADGVTVQMTSHGTISGGGEQPARHLSFDGQASKNKFDLTVAFSLTTATENGLPPETVIQFHYDLERNEAGRETETGSADRDCARIVWQLRNIAGFSGGMQLIRVPVCVN